MKLNPLILAAATVLTGHAQAATIASANFTGLSATNVNTLAASSTAGVNGFNWSRVNNAGTMSIINATLTPGSGNALQFNSDATFRGLIGTMSSVTIDLGETLTLSLNGRYTAAPANNSGSLRLGFARSANLDNAFGLQVGTNGSNALSILRDSSDTTPLGGGVTPLALGTGSQNITTSVYTASFSITRTDTDTYSYLGNINGSTLSAPGIVSGFNNYDAIVVRNGNTNTSFQIDNISVTLVPEPSAALSGGLGLLALLRRRRA